MSTRFAAKKNFVQPVTEDQDVQESVSWEYASDLDTMALSISSRSGGVKIDIGANRRNPFLYANEILAILDKSDEIRRYLSDHPTAKDTPASKKQQLANAAMNAQINHAKNAQIISLTKSMREAGLSEELITLALSKVK